MSARLTDVLDRLGVKWQPTRIRVEEIMKNGKMIRKKTPVHIGDVIAKCNDFTDEEGLSEQELAERKKLLNRATHVAMDTRKFAQIDVDCASALEHDVIKGFMDNTPYFLSCTKKLPHFIIEITGDKHDKTTTGLGMFGKTSEGSWCVEGLHGKWSWADKSADVVNAALLPMKVSREQFNLWVGKPNQKQARKQTVSTTAPCTGSGRDDRADPTQRTTITRESVDVRRPSASGRKPKRSEFPSMTVDIKRRIERYCSSYSPERAENWETWTKVIWGVLNVAYTHHDPLESRDAPLPHARVVEWAREQAHVFSRLSPSAYDAEGVDKLVDEFVLRAKPEERVTFGSLKFWYEEDRGEKDESECESEEIAPPKKMARVDPFDAALSLLRELSVGGLALCGEELMWFNGSVWKTCTETDFNIYCTKNQLRRSKFSGIKFGTLMLASKSDDAYEFLPRTMRSEMFREMVAERSIGNLTFTNGTLNFSDGILMKTTKENAGLCAVKAEFDAQPSEAEDAKIEGFFKDAFPDEGARNVFIHMVARAMAGHVEDKHFGILIGLSNNAKSTLINFLCRAFSGACARFTGAHLSNRSAADPERANAWLGPIEGMRMAFSDELSTSWINGNRLKIVTPGDYAPTRLRRLYEEGKDVLLTAQLFFCLNVFPEIVPLDDGVKNRLVGFPMETTFVDSGDDRLHEENPYVREKDNDLAKELRRNNALHQALFRYILRAYRQPPTKEEVDKVMGWTKNEIDNINDKRDRIAFAKSMHGSLGLYTRSSGGISGNRCPNCIGWIDSRRGNKKYDGYCATCFKRLFPADPRSARIYQHTKEIMVRNFINKHFPGFIHDQPMHYGCDCVHRRRIDHRCLIFGTMLAVETDEFGHRSYDPEDERNRYDDVFLAFSAKWIFIRFNPDGGHGIDMDDKLEKLRGEIEYQMERIENGENKDLLEIIFLF